MDNKKQIGSISVITALVFLILGFMELHEDPKPSTAVLIVGGLFLLFIGAGIMLGKTTTQQQP